MEHRAALGIACILVASGASACASPSSLRAEGAAAASPTQATVAASTTIPPLLPTVPPASPVAVAQCSDSAPAPLVTNIDPSLVPAGGFQALTDSAAANSIARTDTGWLGGQNDVPLSAPAAAKLMSYGSYLALRGQPANDASVSSARCVWVVTVTASVTRARGPAVAPPVTYGSYTVVLDAATGLTVGATAPGVALS